MKKITFIRQRDAKDCGPTCLAMVAKCFGRSLDLKYIREITALSKEGVSLLGISKAAETIGLKSIGGRISFDTLVNEAPLPCIVHWEQNHFVVVYQVKKNRKGQWRVHVADPAKGLLDYTKQEFCASWVSTKTYGEEKGVVLLLEPTSFFLQAGRRGAHASPKPSPISLELPQ